jgi:hypothetical protein
MILKFDGSIRYDNVRSNYIDNCPNKVCKGFINGEFVCTICNTTICKDCREIKFDNDLSIDYDLGNDYDRHECNPDIVKTISLIKNTTKPCPGCNIPIHKLTGCNDMYCLNCKAYFNWVTLRLKSKRYIHNPEYFDELKRNNIQHNPNNADIADIDINTITNILTKFLKSNTHIKEYFNLTRYNVENMFHMAGRTIRGIIRLCEEESNKRFDESLRLRKRYLYNKITQADYKIIIYKTYKTNQLMDDLMPIYNIYVNKYTELLEAASVDTDNFLIYMHEIAKLEKLTSTIVDRTISYYNVNNVNLKIPMNIHPIFKYDIFKSVNPGS